MAKYRIEQDGDTVTVWDDTEGVGLRFTQGETLQRYTTQLIINDANRTATGEGLERLNEISNALTDYAAERFPYEFDTIKT